MKPINLAVIVILLPCIHRTCLLALASIYKLSQTAAVQTAVFDSILPTMGLKRAINQF